MGLGQHRHARGRRDELDAIVLRDRLAPESHRQMCLARTRSPRNRTVSPWAIQRQVASSRSGVDPATAARRSRSRPVRAQTGTVRFLPWRSAAHPAARSRASPGRPKPRARSLRTRCFVQQRVELIPDRGQLQPVEHRDQHLVVDGRHHLITSRLPPA